jgi:hypothetical protein
MVEGCPSKQRWREILAGVERPDADREWIAHLDQCEACWSTVGKLGERVGEVVESGAEVGEERVANVPGASGELGLGSAIGRRVGSKRLLSLLGRGGMGSAYLALDDLTGRLVAVKILNADRRSAEYVAGMSAEARLLSRLKHPNIVGLQEFDLDNEPPYLVFELASGGSLRRSLRRRAFTHRQTAQLLQTVAMAVHAAHEAGVLHLDLKPENILLFKGSADVDGSLEAVEDRPWIPKVSDFGLCSSMYRRGVSAELTRRPIGTLAWMAPEQLSGEAGRLSAATDVYAIGAILYEMLTGFPPFRGSNDLELCGQICRCDPVPPRKLFPKIPARLNEICLRCLQKDPQRRFPSAAILADELDMFLGRRSRGWCWRRMGMTIGRSRIRRSARVVIRSAPVFLAGVLLGLVKSGGRPAATLPGADLTAAVAGDSVLDIRQLREGLVQELIRTDNALQGVKRSGASASAAEVERIADSLTRKLEFYSRELLGDRDSVQIVKEQHPQVLLLARLYDVGALLEEGRLEEAVAGWSLALDLAAVLSSRGLLDENLRCRGLAVAQLLDERICESGRETEGRLLLMQASELFGEMPAGQQTDSWE